jgi:FKBP-type peptidyl-prolyl cis-trans isomerase FklB
MKKTAIILSLVTMSMSVMAQTKTSPVKQIKLANTKIAMTATPPLSIKNGKDSASYALGYRIGQSLKGQGLQDINMAIFVKALTEGFISKSAIPDSLIDNCIKNYQDKMSQEKITANRAAGAAFLAENAKKPGVVKLASGLQYEVIVASHDTTKPTLKSKVKVHYHGTLIDGTVFDSSVQRGEPISFPLNGVIKGWQDALQLMTLGSKWKLFIPSELAYGERSAGPVIGPGSTLIFEVELLGIE